MWTCYVKASNDSTFCRRGQFYVNCSIWDVQYLSLACHGFFPVLGFGQNASKPSNNALSLRWLTCLKILCFKDLFLQLSSMLGSKLWHEPWWFVNVLCLISVLLALGNIKNSEIWCYFLLKTMTREHSSQSIFSIKMMKRDCQLELWNVRYIYRTSN